jgi:beta-glucosidase
LFGKVNPSGKLALTFPKSESQLAHPKLITQPAPGPNDMKPIFPGAPFKVNTRRFEVDYTEGMKVGYRWYEAEGNEPLFPFGFGLSYTTYGYSDLKVTPGETPEVSFTVKNTGSRAGAETAEVYAVLPQAADEPFRRLVAWDKVQLAPGESKTVTLKLNPHYLSIFNESKNDWQLLDGEYKVMVGPSSATTPLSSTFTVGGGH